MTRASRRGFAVPLLLLALFGAGVVWAVYMVRLVGSFDQRAKIQTETALRLARDALVQYAAHAHTPGALPCPDTENTGVAQMSCGSSSGTTIGRLPWRTLGIDPPRDGSGECLWYALSDGARSGSGMTINKRGPAGLQPALNPGWSGSITLHASGTDTKVLAVLFAPGPRLLAQTRAAGDRCNGIANDAANFLEGLDGYSNASGTQAIRAQSSASFNDTILAVTTRDLYSAVVPRVLVELGGTSGAYGFRQLLQIEPASYWGSDEGRPLIDFTSAVVQSAFPHPETVSPPGKSPYASIEFGCTHYVVAGDDGRAVSAPGVYSIEWLCFNQWTQYITFRRNSDTEVVLSEPVFGWQVVATPYAKTRLLRIRGG